MEALKNIQDQKLFNSMDVSLKANIGSGNGLSAFSKVKLTHHKLLCSFKNHLSILAFKSDENDHNLESNSFLQNLNSL